MIADINILKLCVTFTIFLELWVELFYGDDHKWLSYITLALSFTANILLAYLLGGWWLAVFTLIIYLLLRFATFSPGYALGKGKVLTYLGKKSKLDQLEKRLDPNKLLLARLTSLIFFISI